jgi:hypothetical protein
MTPVQTQAKDSLSAFAIRIVACIVHLFGPWDLSFLRGLPAAVAPLPAPLKNKWQPTKRIVRALTTESAAGGGPTYENGLLGFRKIISFYQTNHASFALPVRRASPFVRRGEKATKRIAPLLALSAPNVTALRTKMSRLAPENNSFARNESVCSQAECVVGSRPTYEQELSSSVKQIIFTKRIPTMKAGVAAQTRNPRHLTPNTQDPTPRTQHPTPVTRPPLQATRPDL